MFQLPEPHNGETENGSEYSGTSGPSKKRWVMGCNRDAVAGAGAGAGASVAQAWATAFGTWGVGILAKYSTFVEIFNSVGTVVFMRKKNSKNTIIFQGQA